MQQCTHCPELGCPKASIMVDGLAFKLPNWIQGHMLGHTGGLTATCFGHPNSLLFLTWAGVQKRDEGLVCVRCDAVGATLPGHPLGRWILVIL